MNGFIIALNFLTCIPLKPKNKIDKEETKHTLAYFPLIGLIIGILLVVIYQLFSPLSREIASLMVVISLIIITGVLHLDGFADALEGFYAGTTKEEILRIMRDTNRGTVAIVGLIVIILSKFLFLSKLPNNIILPAIISMPILSRCMLVLSIFTSDYARDDGKVSIFYQERHRVDFFFAAAVCLFFLILFLQFKGIIVFIIVVALTLLLNKFITKKIGGLTGDTLGAINEISEALILFLLLIL